MTPEGGQKPKRKKTKAPEPRPTMWERMSAAVAPGGGLAGAMTTAGRIGAVVIGLGLAIGWIVGREPLQRTVGDLRSDPLTARFDWPMLNEPGRRPATWVPTAVQEALVHTVLSNVSANPFDVASLERGRRLLEATGWFTSVDRLQRLPGGIIAVDATWRVPVALVRKDGRDYLIGADAAPIRIPDGLRPMPGLFVIENPYLGPPSDGARITYGKPWEGGDVQAALALLRLLKDSPAQRQVAGIDLSECLTRDEPKLVIVTDTGTRVVWGAPIGDLAPGQVPIHRRVARLEDQFRGFGRIDAHQDRLEIYTPIVLVDRTASRG